MMIEVIHVNFIELHKYFADYKRMQCSRIIWLDMYIWLVIHIFP